MLFLCSNRYTVDPTYTLVDELTLEQKLITFELKITKEAAESVAEPPNALNW